ncbi:lasso peptide biosynthesis protein [Streptomyces daliensis]|uniref:Lasso peptide biosynthesis protein n=1 Tax=Streptomyces daliensis TaxID=299421 RepID=A0A8T4IP80_9ACTN|nr:lasso peptide biosynthesis protein [Streptomyces daliensis]
MSAATTPDWEFFLTDLDPATAPPRVPVPLRAYALAHTARALWLYRRRGWAGAHPYLRHLRPGPGAAALAALPAGTALRLARREVFASQLVHRALLPDGLCLPRSLALATHLSALGLPAQVTIARLRTVAMPKNSFHSWTELYGTVLNDNPDVQLGYTVLQRVASEASGPAA